MIMEQLAAGVVVIVYRLVLAFLLLGDFTHGQYLQHYTIHGRKCTSRCDARGGDYKYCHTDSSRNWGHCSDIDGRTSHGFSCRSCHTCDMHGGTPYYWCYVEGGDWNKWDYCSPPATTTDQVRLLDSDGFYCHDQCESRGEKYTWCHSDNRKGYGYCSAVPNVAYDGKKCKLDSPCYRHGNSLYSYCYTEGGSWNYCGEEAETSCSLRRRPQQQQQQQDESNDDNQPLKNRTRDDQTGGLSIGHEYNKVDELKRKKRAIEETVWEWLCSRRTVSYEIQLIFLRTQPEPSFMTGLITHRSLDDWYFRDLVAHLSPELIGFHAGTLYRNEYWRLDLQSGPFRERSPRDGITRQWLNLQIQRNGVYGSPSTVSTVLMRADTLTMLYAYNDGAFRRAFVRYQISMNGDFNTLDGRFLPHELRNILPIKKRGQRRLPAPLP